MMRIKYIFSLSVWGVVVVLQRRQRRRTNEDKKGERRQREGWKEKPLTKRMIRKRYKARRG